MNTRSNIKAGRGKLFLYIFLAFFLADLLLIAGGIENGRIFTKPFLMISLGGFFVSQTASGKTVFILLALGFSWLGDILLQWESRSAIYFMLGLSAFLVAHIFYILFFSRLLRNEKIRTRPLVLVGVLLYYVILIGILFPHLGEMKIPVLIYGLVITCMLFYAMHTIYLQNAEAGRWIITGAILFIISDSLLAINKFYISFNGAGLLVMLTYGLAQLFIIQGVIRYSRNLSALTSSQSVLS